MGLISRVSSRTYRNNMFKSVYGSNEPKPKRRQKTETPQPIKVYSMLALSQVKDREALFICPFNDVHHVQRGKYMNHVFSCKRQLVYQGYVQCPFHNGHFLADEALLEHHIKFECPDALEQVTKQRENYFRERVTDRSFDPQEGGAGWFTEKHFQEIRNKNNSKD